MSADDIRRRARFDRVRYANVWEDPGLLRVALEPAPGRRILSIASAGDNAFALLADGAEVVAADVSPAQIALVELKAAAVSALPRDEALAFLGVRPARNRAERFEALAERISLSARDFWRRRPQAIVRGVIHDGRFERYLRAFGRWVLPLVHGRSVREALMAPRTAEERAAFYDRVWNNRRWRWLFRLAMSRALLGRGGRDPEFFRYVEGPVGARLLERVGRALRTLPLDENPWLDYILHGNFTRALPYYLRPAPFERLRTRIAGLTLHLGSIEEAAALHGGSAGFDGFNLSDIFEYLDPPSCAGLYADLLRAAKPGARFAYWNMLAPRRAPPALAARVRPREDLAQPLFERDGAFFYSAFVAEECP